MAVSLPKLDRRLWDAANAIRDPVDPADFKTYVCPIPLNKYGLPTTGPLFDNAYAYVRENY